MGTPSTADVRRIIAGERADRLSDQEKLQLLEARSAQIKPVMQYMGERDLTLVPIPRSVAGLRSFGDQSPVCKIGDFHIDAPKAFWEQSRGLYFYGVRGSQILNMWGLTVRGVWVTVKIHLPSPRRDKPPVDYVEVEIPDRNWFAKYHFRDAWIDLSHAVDDWVGRREALLVRARATQVEMLKQDFIVAPLMETKGHGPAQKFVGERA